MTRAAIYARVSSAAQRDSHTIENQLRTLPAFVASQGWTLAGTFIDDGRSAKSGQLERRTGFAELLAAAEQRTFDVLVVVDVDRLTRTDQIEERALILGPFQRLGIDIVTPSGGRLDMRTMFGELWITIQALGAAEENRKRAERIKAGKARAIAEGRKPAGPTPFGYTYTRATGAWAINEPAAAVVREIFDRVGLGQSCITIAEDLARRGLTGPRTGWTRASVYRVARSRAAVGEYDVDKARALVIRLPPIVPEQAWQDAQRSLLSLRRRGLRRTKHVYLLEGLARCACGAPISIRSATLNPKRARGNPSPAAYVCRARKIQRTCAAPIVPCAETDDRVWAALCDEIEQPEVLAEIAELGIAREADAHDWAADIETHRAHLLRLEKVQAAVMVRFRRGLIGETVVDGELAAIAREASAVRDQLDTARRAFEAISTARARAATPALQRFRAGLPKATPIQRRAVLRELAAEGEVVIDWGRVRLDLSLWLPEESAGEGATPIALVPDQFYRTQHGAIGATLRIRRVA